jgi:hypothetical protein
MRTTGRELAYKLIISATILKSQVDALPDKPAQITSGGGPPFPEPRSDPTGSFVGSCGALALLVAADPASSELEISMPSFMSNSPLREPVLNELMHNAY